MQSCKLKQTVHSYHCDLTGYKSNDIRNSFNAKVFNLGYAKSSSGVRKIKNIRVCIYYFMINTLINN
jgi:hypothetical protein